jgi:riboflavin kinase / FMN adenylyltransferase
MYRNPLESIALGTFDGLHIAHQMLIAQADGVGVIETNHAHLTPSADRSLYTDKPIFFYHLEKIRTLQPEAFIAMLQRDFPKLKKIVVGYDFRFGREKKGDCAMLQKLFGGEVCVVNQVKQGGVAVHSKTIREYLRGGDIVMANMLLGRSYRICGTHISGQGIGGKTLVPTLNLDVSSYRLPHEGVYATRTQIDGVWHKSVSFLGHRLSTDGNYAVESHILEGFAPPHCNTIAIEFVKTIRENKRFDNLETLKTQIDRDIDQAKRILE